MPLMQSSTVPFLQALRQFFRLQGREVLSRINLNGEIDLSHWTDSMVQALQPFWGRFFVQGLIQSARKLPKTPLLSSKVLHRQISKASIVTSWDIFDPKVRTAVDTATLQFCTETLNTLTTDVNSALQKIRAELKAGLERGEAQRVLLARIRSLFTDPNRAYRIVVTESRRALHGGRLLSAKASGVVKAKRWLASADACDRCLDLDGEEVGLDDPFIILPKGGPYAIVLYPPLHPY